MTWVSLNGRHSGFRGSGPSLGRESVHYFRVTIASGEGEKWHGSAKQAETDLKFIP